MLILTANVYFHRVAVCVCISGWGGSCESDQLRIVVYLTEAEMQYADIFISVSAQIFISALVQLNLQKMSATTA